MLCCIACNKNQDAERGSIHIYTEILLHYKKGQNDTFELSTDYSYLLCLKPYQLSSTNLRT